MNTTDHTSDCEAISVQTRLQVDECNINRSITVGEKSSQSSLNEKKKNLFLPSIKSNNRFNHYFKNLYYVNWKKRKSHEREKYPTQTGVWTNETHIGQKGNFSSPALSS